MDKKNTIIGVALLAVGTYFMITNGLDQKEAAREEALRAAEEAARAAEAPAVVAPAGSDATAVSSPSGVAPVPAPTVTPASGHAVTEANEEREGEEFVTLSNKFVQIRFTNLGGAVREIELAEYAQTLGSEERYVMNQLRYSPALNLKTVYGDARNIRFERVADTQTTVTYRAQLSDQLAVERRYTLGVAGEKEGPEPYTLTHELTFINLTDTPLALGSPEINMGTVAPSGQQDRELQTFGYKVEDDVEFIKQGKFLGSNIPFFSSEPRDFIQEDATLQWASLKNQFFLTLLTPQDTLVGFTARPVDFPGLDDEEIRSGLTADVKLPAITLAPSERQTTVFDFYAGPKKHGYLTELDRGQQEAMQFGFFGLISKFLLLILNGIQGYVVNWGVAIILLTVVVRGSLLPITLMSMKSMRRMSKLQEPMKIVKERYPDDPRKQQQMMMELYKVNKINPIGGCLPMLLQIPVFFALFYMLRGAAELRFADFLWIQDLSHPDTVATIPNFPIFGSMPINLLPFVWLITLAYQMWTMPTPTVDNAQTKMMKYMPFIFFPFTYTFSSGLVLYWTVSNVFTIGQQWLAKRGADDFEPILPPALKKAIKGDGKKKHRKNNNS